MLKKIAAVLLMLAIICVPSIPSSAQELELNAPAAVLMEASSGRLLFEKNPHEKRPCASITKVMTLLLTMEAIESGTISMDDTLYASAHAASMGGSDIWLKEGEAMTVNELIKATVIMSANDAAVVLAEAVAGSEDSFVAMMNEKAKELGMDDTTFKNCNGLDEEGHLTSAYDVALMSRALIRHEKIFDYTLTWIDYLRDGQTQLVNTNKLIKSYKGITGLKTGTTSQAGSCISATAKRDGMSLVSVVLGCDSTDNRFKDAAALLNYGFAKWTVVSPEIPPMEQVAVKGGMKDFTEVKVEGNAEILTQLGSKDSISCEIVLDEEIKAPISPGQQLGVVKIFSGKELLRELPIKALDTVEEISFSKAIWYFLSQFNL